MRKRSRIPLMLIVFAAAALIFFLGRGYGGPAYVVSTTDEYGVSLLFDTLRHMDYQVSVGNRPVDRQTDIWAVSVIIQPSIIVNDAMAKEMLYWVSRGGRLIFLQNRIATVIDSAIITGDLAVYVRLLGNFDGFTLYQVGNGEVLTGRALPLSNQRLMNDPAPGGIIHSVLERWNADRITFAEYYHGFQLTENFIGSLPLIVRLILLQMLIVAVMMVWFLGKRFGNPIPYYEETEREENEYVRALARLYMKIKRRRS
ncbi:MAG: hypothetical protein FWB91_01795 [Defluviitaleaceae bacterium]|nr:hypothetical protein [Defluviitaleaceae bacterium]